MSRRRIAALRDPGMTSELRRQLLVALAESHKLSYPQGRAAYVLNRLANTWPVVMPSSDQLGMRRLTELEVMQRMREATAVKWDAHARAGGAIKKFGVSQADYNREKREAADRRLPEGARLRREVRRAKRKAKEGQP